MSTPVDTQFSVKAIQQLEVLQYFRTPALRATDIAAGVLISRILCNLATFLVFLSGSPDPYELLQHICISLSCCVHTCCLIYKDYPSVSPCRIHLLCLLLMNCALFCTSWFLPLFLLVSRPTSLYKNLDCICLCCLELSQFLSICALH